VINLDHRREVGQIPAGEEPAAARVSPDGKTLVVANRRSGSVSTIDPASGRVRAVFGSCPGAAGVLFIPDSSKAFVPCSGGHQVMVIAMAQPDAHPPQPDRLETLMDVGRAPIQLALKPDGGEIFASNSLSDSVSEIYDSSDEVGDTYMIGNEPVFGLVSRDNLLFEANRRSQQVTVYSIDDGKLLGSVHVGDGPMALAFSAAGNLLFVADSRSGDVAAVRPPTGAIFTADRPSAGSLFTLLPAGRDPNAIVDKAFKLP
jgi:DNA-binding beta-propeller fold protein YncE